MAHAHVAQMAPLFLDPQRFGQAEIRVPDHAEHRVQPPGDSRLDHDVADRPARMRGSRHGDLDCTLVLAHLERADLVIVAHALARAEREVVAVPRASDGVVAAQGALGQRAALVRTSTVQRVPPVVGVNERACSVADVDCVDAPRRQVGRRTYPDPPRPGRVLAPVCLRDGVRFVIRAAGIPMVAVAEWFVARGSAAAQREVFPAGTGPKLGATDLHAAAHEVTDRSARSGSLARSSTRSHDRLLVDS